MHSHTNSAEQEMEKIRLILSVSAKGHDNETIANALDLSADYVETILELADSCPDRSPEAIVTLLGGER